MIRAKGYTVYLDKTLFPCIAQVEVTGFIWKGKDFKLIGMSLGKEIDLPFFPESDLCDTLEDAFLLWVRKFQNWN